MPCQHFPAHIPLLGLEISFSCSLDSKLQSSRHNLMSGCCVSFVWAFIWHQLVKLCGMIVYTSLSTEAISFQDGRHSVAFTCAAPEQSLQVTAFAVALPPGRPLQVMDFAPPLPPGQPLQVVALTPSPGQPLQITAFAVAPPLPSRAGSGRHRQQIRAAA